MGAVPHLGRREGEGVSLCRWCGERVRDEQGRFSDVATCLFCTDLDELEPLEDLNRVIRLWRERNGQGVA